MYITGYARVSRACMREPVNSVHEVRNDRVITVKHDILVKGRRCVYHGKVDMEIIAVVIKCFLY